MPTASWCVTLTPNPCPPTTVARPHRRYYSISDWAPRARCVSLPATRSHRPSRLPVSQVKPEHVDAYRRNAPMYVTEETERAERWDAFLSQSREEVADASSISGDVNTNGNSASGASASTSGDAFGRRTLDAVVRVLEARAVRGAEGCRVGAETSRTIPDEERELNALVAVSLFLSSYVQLV